MRKRPSLDVQGDRFAALKADYDKAGPNPSNLRYGYVNTAPDHAVFG